MGKVRKGLRQPCFAHRGQGYETSGIPFFLLLSSGRNLPAYISYQTPTQIFVVTPLPTCHRHIARKLASFRRANLTNFCGHTCANLSLTQCTWTRRPPTQFTGHFHLEHLHWDYFRYQLYFHEWSTFCCCMDRCPRPKHEFSGLYVWLRRYQNSKRKREWF